MSKIIHYFQLVKLNLIEKKGKGPNTHYNETKISPNLAKNKDYNQIN